MKGIPLFLHEIIHFILCIFAAFFIAQVYKESSFTVLIIIALLGGFFIDIDHLIDYAVGYGFKFNVRTFLKGKHFVKNQKILVLFHAYEYVIILVMLGLIQHNPVVRSYIFVLSISSLLHLIADACINNVYIKTYSIIFRILYNFDLKKITPSK